MVRLLRDVPEIEQLDFAFGETLDAISRLPFESLASRSRILSMWHSAMEATRAELATEEVAA